MTQRWRQTLRNGVQRLNHLLTAKGVVLLYHRIADSPSDPYALSVSPARFESHLEVIRKLGTPVHLHDMADALRRSKPIRRGVSITFDDAYQDNLYTAKPLLERHGLPATVYATTGCGRTREFWWDELARIFLSRSSLPERLDLEVDGARIELDLGPSAKYDETEWERHRGWTFEHDTTPTQRHAAFVTAYELLRPLSHDGRVHVLDEILTWSGREAVVRAEYRALEPDELVALENGGLISVGAHTVTHPSLPSRPARDQEDEISRSRQTLEEWLGHPVTSFAYPYGHVSASAEAALRESGFHHACSCRSEPVRRSSGLFTLPRIDVGDWEDTAFERRLRWYLGT